MDKLTERGKRIVIAWVGYLLLTAALWVLIAVLATHGMEGGAAVLGSIAGLMTVVPIIGAVLLALKFTLDWIDSA